MSLNQDEKKILLKLAQFKTFISDFFIKEKNIELIFQGLDLNLKVPDTSFFKDNSNDDIGDSLLHLAFKEDDIDAYNILICKGADFNVKDEDGNTVLHNAFSDSLLKANFGTNQNLFITSTLAAHLKYKNANNPFNSYGLTHFHIACTTNDIEVVQFFLNNGVPVDQVVKSLSSTSCFEGYTPLHFAVHYGQIKVTEVLLAHGANTELRDANDRTPFHVSIKRNIELTDFAGRVSLLRDIENNRKIMILLLKYNTNSNGLHLYAVCFTQNFSNIDNFLSQGIDVNMCISMDSKIWPGYSALHFAAHINPEIVKVLIAHGANIEVKNANEVTPFDMCIDRFSAQDICEILHLTSNWKNIVLSDPQIKLVDLFIALRNLDSIKHFLRKSAGNIKLCVPIDSPLWPGFTVLHLAILLTERTNCKTDYKYIDGKGSFDPDLTILTECLKQDADVTVKDKRNWTAIHFAYRLQKYKTVDLLLQYHHRSNNCVDDENLSHLHIACAAKNQHLVKRLLWNEADVNIVYKGKSVISSVYPGWTPLHIAVHVKDYKTVKLLLKFGADIHAIDEHGFTPIHLLMHFECPQELSETLFSVPNIHDCVVKDLGLSYLHIACWTKNVNAVKQLLDFGADINRPITFQQRDGKNYVNVSKLEIYDGSTPLHFALLFVSVVKLDLVSLLIERGADILIKNSRSVLPLTDLLEFEKDEHIDVVFTALKRNEELRKRVETETGVTMLHLACFKFDARCIKELLDNGADVNAQIDENSSIWPKYTGLHVSLSRDKYSIEDDNYEEVIKLLLNRGADVTLPNDHKNSPLHMVYEQLLDADASYRDCLSWLLKAHKNFEINPISSEGFSHFHIACHILDSDVVENFLEHGVDVNATIEAFSRYEVAACTPLHLAIRRLNLYLTDSTKSMTDSYEQLRIIDLLIKHGADLNIEDVNGNTPVHYTSSCSFLKENFLQRLANSGANMNSKNISGETPLGLLLNKKSFTLEEVRYFIASGCRLNEFNAVTDTGYIALADSVLSHADMQLLLIGAFVNSPISMNKLDDVNRTAVHNIVSINATKTGNMQYVDLFDILMKFDCDIDDQDNLGRTPLHLAVLFRNESAVKGLLSSGADINITDRDGKTPFAHVFEPCSLCLKANHSDHDQYSHFDLFQIFIRHIKKMEICNIRVNETNDILLNKALERFDLSDITFGLADILSEMIDITDLKIEPYSLTVADFVSNEPIAIMDYPTMSLAKRRAVDTFFRTNKKLFQEQFKTVAGILQFQYRQTTLRYKIINTAKDSLTILMRFRLPDICSHMILRLLKNYELQNLILATA